MLPFFRENFVNPSSRYSPAFAARAAVEEARANIAEFIGARAPNQIVFTSGGTESISLALSVADSDHPRQIITSTADHSAVLAAAARWARTTKPFSVPVDKDGLLDVECLKAHISRRPSLVSFAHANNETGVIYDVEELTRVCGKYGASVHCDAIQTPGKLKIDTGVLNCDYLSLSAHKFHGPKGVGVLYARDPSTVRALLPGHHEFGLRGGTENVAGIVGASAAVTGLCDWQVNANSMSALRDQLECGILDAIPNSEVNGRRGQRLCNTTNIYFPHRNAADLVELLGRRAVYVSAGAACSTGGEPSHVIQAMGLGRERANSSIRFSLSRFTSQKEIERAIAVVVDTYFAALPTYGATS
jgi:cysteine desulfurase